MSARDAQVFWDAVVGGWRWKVPMAFGVLLCFALVGGRVFVYIVGGIVALLTVTVLLVLIARRRPRSTVQVGVSESDARVAARLCVQAINRIGRVEDLRVVADASDHTNVLALLGPGSRSAGESISIRIESDAGQCSLAIASTSRVRGTRFDFRANEENVRGIVRDLSQHYSALSIEER